ncbi:RidA family protein (plasmid) [Streptomyces sp. BI20]|uniref:RidA family protein n=1 Tax=Streptomyces sp. BI20 TaxID=3403460 RepID=UPI003C77EEBA
MAVENIDPPELPKPYGWRQVAVGTGDRLVFLSGQVAKSADGTPVGTGDLAAQTEQVYLNIATGLAAGGASFDDVLRLTVYVKDWHLDKWEAITAGPRARPRNWAWTWSSRPRWWAWPRSRSPSS